ncbi:hypothetical protein D6J61_25755 [Salmonella enterica subsp. enterica serovar Alachua]|nr:hypothetical protein [Salmonella enterica subsp. enterica serovar Alachua]
MTLIDRLSKLDGPDREVDYAVFCALARNDYPNEWHPKVGNQHTATPESRTAAIALLRAKEDSKL